MSLADCITTLSDKSKQLSYKDLVALSALAPEELTAFHKTWLKVNDSKRREIVNRLVDLAEDNLDVDFEGIFMLCLKDKDVQVKSSAIEGLWECDNRILISILSSILVNDESVIVRAKAAMALSKFALLSHLGKMLNKDSDNIIATLTYIINSESEDNEVKRRAIESIAPFDTNEVQSIIQKAYLNEDQRMKYSAIYAMGKSNNPHWIPTIVRELKSADSETRYEAANACGEMAEEDLIPDLLELFDDDDIEIQSSAVGAVGNIGGNMARRALLNTLNVSDPTLAEAAQTALAKLDAGEDLVDISINPYDRLSN